MFIDEMMRRNRRNINSNNALTGRPKIRTRVMGPRLVSAAKKRPAIISQLSKTRANKRRKFDVVDMQSERRKVHMRSRFSIRERDMVRRKMETV